MNEKALDNRCPSCGAPIFFNPTLGIFKCDYCDSEFSLKQMQKHNNASSIKHNEEVNTNDDVYYNYTCKDCGASIVADENTSATFCLYCGNAAILKSKLAGKFQPKKIILFKKEKEYAITCFKNLSKGRPLMPKSFNNEKNIEKITGIYIPFWLFDVNVKGEVEAKATKISTWVVGNRHFTKTDIYKLIRGVDFNYDKVPVDGSSRFDNDIMNSIEPFDYKELIEYNHAYLSGFFSEKYDVISDKAVDDALTRSYQSVMNDINADMNNYGAVKIVDNGLSTKTISNEYVLLPVWMVNVKYNNKYYTFAMNGQTGEFLGNIPVDIEKTIIISSIIFISVFLLTLLGSYIVFLLGGI